MVVLHQEFRMQAFRMLVVAVFGSRWITSETLSQFKTNEIHYDYGVCLRIRVNKEDNTNIRIDYGFTKDSQG